MSNDFISFRVEESTYRLRKMYECRYIDIPKHLIPDDWEAMSEDDKVQYLYDHGDVTWLYDEEDPDYNEPADKYPIKVLSIEERN